MAICAQRHTNLNNQTTLLDGVDVGPPKWGVCGRGLNGSVHEGMKDISNVKVHLKTHSGNVNIIIYLRRSQVKIVKGQWSNLMCSYATPGFIQASLSKIQGLFKDF